MATNRFLVRFVQQHPAFRRSELESCALLSDCKLKQPLNFVEYDDASPFAVLELNADANAAALVKRSILTQ
jgi:tRNA G10  N-methylase Trm11